MSAEMAVRARMLCSIPNSLEEHDRRRIRALQSPVSRVVSN